MARFQEDELFGDDLEAVLKAIDEDILEKNEEFSSQINADVNASTTDAVKSFPCALCTKVCVSQRGLTRHKNAKHKDVNTDVINENNLSTEPSSSDPKEPRIHPLVFKKLLQSAAEKLSKDECYPKRIMSEFKTLTFANLEDASPYYELVKDLIEDYNGDLEKFNPLFLKAFSNVDASFNTGRLSRHSHILLGLELVNHVLVRLSGAKIQDEMVCFDKEPDYSDKEKSIIFYLSGYVVGTLYRKIRFSKKSNDHASQQLSFLIACQFNGDETNTDHQKLVNLKDRGGLWKVNVTVFSIFKTAEFHFLQATKNFTTKIDSKGIVSSLLKDPWILACFSKIRSKSESPVQKEVAMNLFEDMLSLYIRVRSHSYAKNKQQLHKIQSGKTKARSLRTDMKQKSSSLDMGH